MAIRAEDYVPTSLSNVFNAGGVKYPLGLQIGDILIAPYAYIDSFAGNEHCELLLSDGSTFNELVYVDLYAALGSNVLPNIADETGSPFPYYCAAKFNEGVYV